MHPPFNLPPPCWTRIVQNLEGSLHIHDGVARTLSSSFLGMITLGYSLIYMSDCQERWLQVYAANDGVLNNGFWGIYEPSTGITLSNFEHQHEASSTELLKIIISMSASAYWFESELSHYRYSPKVHTARGVKMESTKSISVSVEDPDRCAFSSTESQTSVNDGRRVGKQLHDHIYEIAATKHYVVNNVKQMNRLWVW